jgi:GT2 family glycosyltransferase
VSAEPEAERPAEVFAACAGAALYRRDAFLDAGGFDERFFCYLEDVDLSFRLQLAGHRCRYVPDSVVDHVGGGTAGVESEFTVYHSHRNMVWAWLKNMPAPLALLYAPQHVGANLASVLWFARRGLGGVVWRAKRDALRELPRVLRERRAVQRRRRTPSRELRSRMAGGLSVYHATEARHAVDRFRDRLLTRAAAR